MLLVFGAAIVGVLVEAFVPGPLRRPMHLAVALGGLVAAFVADHPGGLERASSPTAARATSPRSARSAVDRPTLFIQGTILVLAFISVLLIAESSHEVSAFAAQAAAVPGSAEEREGLQAGITPHRGVPAHPVRGRRHAAVPRRQRPADHVRGARGAVAAAVPALRPGPAAPAAVAGSGHEVLPARLVLLGVLPVRHRDAVRLLRLGAAVRDRDGRARPTPPAPRCCTPGIALLGIGLLFKIGAVPFQSWKPDVYQGAPDAGHRADGVLHPGVGVRRAAARLLRRRSAS